MGKKRKRRVNNMAWDYQLFRSRYQWENNPGVEPTELLKDDDATMLVYRNPGNVKLWYTAKQFFDNSLWEIMPSVSDGHQMAMDYPIFRKFFQQENNHQVDPYSLRKIDESTHLININTFKEKTIYTPQGFFRYKMWETIPFKKYEMAMDHEEFRNIFQQENNKKINPYTLRKWDKKTHLTYINPYNVKMSYTPRNFFRGELWKTMPYREVPKRSGGYKNSHCKEYEMAMDYEEFRNIFQQENNPQIDPYTIRKWDNKPRLIYINQYGIKMSYIPCSFFRYRLWEEMPYRKTPKKRGGYKRTNCKDHGMATERRSGKARKQRTVEMAMDSEEFREFFQKENNPGVDPYTLKKWRDYTPLIHINQYGVVTHYTPHYFFHKRIWEYVPYRQYKPGETVNALALDEDLALYVKTEKDREKLLNTGVHTKKAFHCPFCGYEFSKKLIDMINCSPKCPFCNDTGMYEEASDDEINGAYLKRT